MEKSPYNRADYLPAAENPAHADYYPPSPQGGSLSSVPATRTELKLVKDRQQQKWEQYVYESVIEIGTDIHEATAGEFVLTPTNFLRLQQEQMADRDISIDEVLKVFDGEWSLVAADIEDAHRLQQAEKAAARQKVLDEIKEESRQGHLPAQLFRKINTEARITTTKEGKAKTIKVAILTDGDVGKDKQITRYTRFVIARRLTEVFDVNDFDLQAAVTGAYFENETSTEGEITHGYCAKLQNLTGEENVEVIREDIGHLADIHDWRDFVFPRERQEHLAAIRRICKKISVRVYSPAELVDRVLDEYPQGQMPTFYYDTAAKKIIEGDEALSQYLDNSGNSKDVHLLEEILRADVRSSEGRLEPFHEEWPEEKYKKYGRWLSGIVTMPEESRKKSVNQKLLDRARQLGIGPGRYAVIETFGSLTAYYKEAGIADAKRMGSFDDWTLEDFIAYIKEVGGDSLPTMAQFNELHKKDPDKPHRDLMHNKFLEIGGFNGLLKLAGYEVIPTWEESDYIDWGVRFVAANGYLPTARALDFLSAQKKGPSSVGVFRKFGSSICNFHQAITDALHQGVQYEPSTERVENLKLGEDYAKFRAELKTKNREAYKKKIQRLQAEGKEEEYRTTQRRYANESYARRRWTQQKQAG